jgi:A/G-specific adenine glycosylase
MTDKKAQFRPTLLAWFANHLRPMPWKGIKNPYFIWLSEIILQQTQVKQGLPYYEHFIEKYPTVFDLAAAAEDTVMKSWEGLGYYSRARNLHAAAKQIVNNFDGKFPDSYEAILSLKGVGPYTAAAISSFAFDLPHAVVDGNVYRVLSRYFGIDTPIDSTEGKRFFNSLALTLLDKKQPAAYNQAIMDFGATQCTPKRPKCSTCPFAERCSARLEDRIAELPVKSKKITKKHRFFNYIILHLGDQVLLHKRKTKDIWANLYEFPLLEAERLLERSEIDASLVDGLGLVNKNNNLNGTAKFIKVSKPFQQTLTHQKINARFWEYRIPETSFDKNSTYILVQKDKLSTFAFPKIIDWYFRDNSLYLELF